MQVAFHFQESTIEAPGWPPQQTELERALLAVIAEVVPRHRLHMRIRCGAVTTRGMPDDPPQRRAVINDALTAPGIWRTVRDTEHLADTLQSHDLIAAIFEGLSVADAGRLDERLSEVRSYLGAVQVRPEFGLHFALYLSLPYRFRLFGRSVWLLHTIDADPPVAGEDNRDHAWRNWLEDSLRPYGFTEIDFQSIELQETVFDPYHSQVNAAIFGRARSLLTTYYEAVVDEILIRSRDADPRLIETLDAALGSLDRHETREHIAQAAVSCRRFLERLANVLYPPRDEEVNGRKVGKKEYRNRLWAYAEERLSGDTKAGVALASLTDIGARIDHLDKIANKGVHSDASFGEAQRLVLSLVLVTYNLLSLSPPTGDPGSSYEQELKGELLPFFRRTLNASDREDRGH